MIKFFNVFRNTLAITLSSDIISTRNKLPAYVVKVKQKTSNKRQAEFV